MADSVPDPNEQEELRQLIAKEKRRIDAMEDLLGLAVADEASYRLAFKRLLELLPDDSRLRVTNSHELSYGRSSARSARKHAQ